MHFAYIIKSKTHNFFYIGSTDNLKRRIGEHNNGKSKFTSKFKPFKCVYLEGYATKEDALDREKSLKYFGKVYAQLKRRIKRSLDT